MNLKNNSASVFLFKKKLSGFSGFFRTSGISSGEIRKSGIIPEIRKNSRYLKKFIKIS